MDDFNARLQMNHDRLSTKELQLATWLSEHQAHASAETISSLAAAAAVSTATVSRFAKNLGYPNFAALRVALGQVGSGTPTLFEEIEATDSLAGMADKVFAANIEALTATRNALSPASLSAAVKLLTHARYINLFGLGASNIVALDGYHKFLRTPFEVRYAADFHMQLMAATRMGAADVAVVISHTGEDHDALALAELVQGSGAQLIVITGAAHSDLAKRADVLLVSVAEETAYRSEALHAMIAQLTLMDTLFTLTAVKSGAAGQDMLGAIRETIGRTRGE